ncbi:MAG: homoserine kinase [Woeseiaceae bacterium]
MTLQRAVAFAPASIGNVAVGFDLLGLAIDHVGDTVVAERSNEPGIHLAEIVGDDIAADANQLSLDPKKNTATLAAEALWRDAGETDGLTLKLRKGTPLGSGMGSSAASAVASVVAANALLTEPRSLDSLIDFAVAGEAFASGALHADNVAPSLLGGLVFCPSRLLPHTMQIPVPDDIVSVLVHPHLRVNTVDARRALREDVPLQTVVEQSGRLAGFVHACHTNARDLIASCLADVMIEPQRARFVDGFQTVKDAALEKGALGCSLSGSGPSVFALAGVESAEPIRNAMIAAFRAIDVASDAWISPMNCPGARVLET